MYVDRIMIENIRNFAGGASRSNVSLRRPDGRHAGWTVFTGRNGSGKTTLLQAMALAVAGPDLASSLQQRVLSWVRRNVDGGSVRLDLVADPGFDRAADSHEREVRVGLDWLNASPLRGAYPSPADDSWSGARRGPWNPKPDGWFMGAYGAYRRIANSRRGQGADQSHRRRMLNLFYEHSAIHGGIEWFKALSQRAPHDDVANGLMFFLADLISDDLLPDRTTILTWSADHLALGRAPAFPEDGDDILEASNGYRATFALVLDLCRLLFEAYGRLDVGVDAGGRRCVRVPGVVIIDEIDAHLHVSWQQRIGFWLKAHFPNIQFLVTTHSPFVCQAADPGGLIVLPGPETESPIQVLDHELEKRVIHGTIDEVVLSALFGLEQTRTVESEALVQEYSRLRAGEIRGRLEDDELSQLRALKSKLPV